MADLTIAAAYLTSEGVVLGADSTTTVVGLATPQGQAVQQLFEHAQKVFEVGEKSRLGVCTWGAGVLGDVSHRTLIAQLAERLSPSSTVNDAALELQKMALELVTKHRTSNVGYFIGGWDPGSHAPACFELDFAKGQSRLAPLPVGCCAFAGMHKFFGRVFRGYDQRLPGILLGAIKERLGEKAAQMPEFDKIFDDAFKQAATPLAAKGYQDIPIREAIDYVNLYLHVSIKATKFEYGPPMCGGPIEVAFISSDRNFRWACHKEFTSALKEGQEGLHDV